MGAIHRLPEELVHDVLSYALHIPLDDFFLVDTETDDAETKPRLRTASPPPSAFLLVSKQWHRIGLPLLYASLALSSSGALHAVAAAVTADPRLGRAIRAVRLRGAYGPALYTILRAAPQLRALSIATTAAAEDSLAGLRRAVPALDPRVLCVYSPLGGRGGWNAKRCQLDALLQSAVRTWRNLDVVHFCPSNPWVPSSLLGALVVLPSLKLVSFDLAHIESAVILRTLAPLNRLTTNPALEGIVCRGERAPERIAEIRQSYCARFGELARPQSLSMQAV